MQSGTKFNQQQVSGQADLLDFFEATNAQDRYVQSVAWSERTRLDFEKETLGLYLTGHPTDAYLREFKSFICPLGKLDPSQKKRVITCGLISNVRKIDTKSGKKLVIVVLSDAQTVQDVVVFSQLYDPCADQVITGQLLVIEGELSQDTYTKGIKLKANALYSLEQARTHFAKCLSIVFTSADQAQLAPLKKLLNEHPGRCMVQLQYMNDLAKANINLAAGITPTELFLDALKLLFKEEHVTLCY